ncbi:ribulose 1,5-bisphosphate carboxylase [Mucilaginibacter limnophilus]|uniref:Ribulose 1,5-bisphosphate carboxylase n=1 Tax=Mucilaginibacter limnophilus TaxID=1932778 RepID=A0A437MZ18_9SPHI|nr:ribulose-bisphosphate carboxylase large subunit family protein [Mucilaginibacter limnophilus]RVU02912.1 ribulose 1,5-bisphosphate carboxylase [Mucilaginibacter limnophilus]
MNTDNIIRAKYLIETSQPLEKAAQMMAGEQSCGTFVRVPGETDELREQFSAKVELIEELGTVPQPTLPGAKHAAANVPVQRAIVQLAWPFHNVGANLPNLMATVAGNLYELNPFSGLKLLDVEIPPAFADKYPGPQFGIEGTRKLTGVYNRPVIGTIIKPSVGLTPEATAAQTETLIEVGLDFLKDDELMGNPPHSPFEKRVKLVMDVINRYADKTGKKPMYAFNISGDVDDMLNMHDVVLNNGGTCVMVSINHVGLSGFSKLRQHAQLPIHGHRNFWGALSRSEVLGVDFQAYQKIWRLAGVDHLHTNGIRNKFCEADESVIKSIKSCLTPMLDGYPVMPVISSGQWAGQAVDTYNAINSTDVMYVCGGGIVAHPAGIAAGVRSVVQAWEAAIKGESLAAYAEKHIELKQAIEVYG